MIYSKELSNQFVYLEFSTGAIQLAEVKTGARDFIIVRDLSAQEAAAVRKKFKLN